MQRQFHEAPTPRPSLSLEWMGLLFLLVVLGVSKYDPTLIALRRTDAIEFYTWFWRYRLAGFASFFDLLTFGLLSLVLVRIVAARRLRLSAFDTLLATLLVLVVAGSAVAFLSRGPEDGVTEMLFQLRNYFYLGAAYFLTSRLKWTESRYRTLAATLVVVTLIILALSYWEFLDDAPRVTKYGQGVLLRDETDGIYGFYVQMLAVALYSEGVVRSRAGKLALGAVILWSLYAVFTSFSKTLIVLYPVALGYFAWHYGVYKRRWFVPVFVAAMCVLAGVLLAFTNLRTILADPKSALFVYSTFVDAEDFSSATRFNQIVNFPLNLWDRGAVVQGIGLGNKWYEYVPQFPYDEAAYPPAEIGTRWHLGVHVPLLRLFYDFGVLGAGALIGVLVSTLLKIRRRVLEGWYAPATNACLQAAILVTVYQLTINNLGVPKTNLLIGVILGATSGLLAQQPPPGAPTRLSRQPGPAL